MRRHIKDFLRSIFDKFKKEIDNNAVDNTSHDNPINKELVDVDMGAWHKCTNAFKSVNMQTASSITISVTNEGKVEINFSYDEDILDTDFYFEEYGMNTFNDLIK